MATPIVLAWLGLCLGSFAGALVWRIRHKKDWVRSRSQCESCGHSLKALDLVPVLSWVFLGARCRYCKKKLSLQYPLMEIALASVFLVSYYFWPGGLITTGDWVLFITWLICLVGLLALLVYDLHFMLLPAGVAILGRLIYIVGYEPNRGAALLGWGLSIAVASGIFALIYLMSQGKWIGDGDISLGIITGTLLADFGKSFLMIFLACLLGSLVAAPAIISRRKTMAAKLAFGPFLIVATAISLLFGGEIIDWYKGLLIP
jgi:prepilin signal peptidase PulO-like enzyme (type II secretory pathway)